jgi:hypothetical protein
MWRIHQEFWQLLFVSGSRALLLSRHSLHPDLGCALRRRGAHSGKCFAGRLYTNQKYEKIYYLKPPIILGKNVGHKRLTTHLVQLKPTLLKKINYDLKKCVDSATP